MTGLLIWIAIVGLLTSGCALGIVALQRRARLSIGAAHLQAPR